jgi:hypothetical protein
LTASAIATALQGCKKEPEGTTAVVPEKDWSPAFLDKDQLDLVADLSETLIPETEKAPGAKAVKVHQYIDDELQNFYRPAEQYRFLQGLNDVQARAQAAHNKRFQDCTAEEKAQLLNTLEQETQKLEDAGNTQGPLFFRMLKNMTFNGYFTSEKVCKEVLKFDPIPGEYNGCIALADVGGLWTLD